MDAKSPASQPSTDHTVGISTSRKAADRERKPVNEGEPVPIVVPESSSCEPSKTRQSDPPLHPALQEIASVPAQRQALNEGELVPIVLPDPSSCDPTKTWQPSLPPVPQRIASPAKSEPTSGPARKRE